MLPLFCERAKPWAEHTHAHIEKRSNQMKKLSTVKQCFGAAAMLMLSTAAVAGSAPPGTLLGEFPNPVPQPASDFGSVLSASKKQIAVSAPLGSDTQLPTVGVAYLFDIKTRLLRGGFSYGDSAARFFGSALSLGAKDLLIGAPGPADAPGGGDDARLVDLKILIIRAGRTNPDKQEGDRFGAGVLSTKSYHMVGAPNHDDNASSHTGVAYLFALKSTSPTPAFTLHPPTSAENQFFGSSFALPATSLAISAPGNESQYGAVHLYDAKTLAFQATRTANTPHNGDGYGKAIAASKTSLVVGAPGDAGGKVYLYDLKQQITHVINNPAGGSHRFGQSVAILGKNILVGAPDYSTTATLHVGRAYVFNVTGQLVQTMENLQSTPEGRFGEAVASDGKSAIVGAPGNSGDTGVVYQVSALTK
jgi:hypothetical protein